MSHEQSAFGIPVLCRRNNISRAKYYTLPPELRPLEMRIGGSVRVTPKAEADWHEMMEHITALGLTDIEEKKGAAVKWRQARTAALGSHHERVAS